MAEGKWKRILTAAGTKKKAVIAALLMTAGLSIPAHAAGIDLISEKNSGDYTDVNTDVYLGVVKETPPNVSFEVPLYYTVAVVSDNSGTRKNKVLIPSEGYYIENRTYEDKQKGTLQSLAVTQMRVQGVKNAEWSLVDQVQENGPETNREMCVTIGGVKLPAIQAGDTQKAKDALLQVPGSAFCKQENGDWKFKLLGTPMSDSSVDYDRRMNLDVDVKVAANYTPEEKLVDVTDPDTGTVNKELHAITQFKVMYTLAPLDADGNPIGKYDKNWVDQNYDGPYNE